MILPEFAKKAVRPYQCPKCRQTVKPSEAIAVEVGIRKRPEMDRPNLHVHFECPFCGLAVGVGLPTSINWTHLIHWLCDMAAAEHRAELPNGLVSADEVPKHERVWLRLPDDVWMFRLLGAYRRANQTFLLVRRVPQQPAGWDGRVWDGVLRVGRERAAEIVTEDNEFFLPLSDWDEFMSLPEGNEFRLGGKVWHKLTARALRKICRGGTLTQRAGV